MIDQVVVFLRCNTPLFVQQVDVELIGLLQLPFFDISILLMHLLC